MGKEQDVDEKRERMLTVHGFLRDRSLTDLGAGIGTQTRRLDGPACFTG